MSQLGINNRQLITVHHIISHVQWSTSEYP